jgi:hypothetical protein
MFVSFLHFVVDAVLGGQCRQLKAYTIATGCARTRRALEQYCKIDGHG